MGGHEAPLLSHRSWTWGNGGTRGSGHGDRGGGYSSSLTREERSLA